MSSHPSVKQLDQLAQGQLAGREADEIEAISKECVMSALETKVRDFLAQKRIAVAGVSRKASNTGTVIYRKLKAAGYDVVPVNPNTETVEGEPCYPDIVSIPGEVGGVVVVTRPEVTEEIVRQCRDASVPRVWLHQTVIRAGTSVSREAVQFCDENNISVIAGTCPMMYCEPVDVVHRCMRWALKVTHKLPN